MKPPTLILTLALGVFCSSAVAQNHAHQVYVPSIVGTGPNWIGASGSCVDSLTIDFGSQAISNPYSALRGSGTFATAHIVEDAPGHETHGIWFEYDNSNPNHQWLIDMQNLGYTLKAISAYTSIQSVSIGERMRLNARFIYENQSGVCTFSDHERQDEKDWPGHDPSIGGGGHPFMWGSDLTLQRIIDGKLKYFFIWYDYPKQRDEFDINLFNLCVRFELQSP